MTNNHLPVSSVLHRALVALAFIAMAAVLALSVPIRAHAQEQAVAIPAAAFDPASAKTSDTAILAGGCFWGVQAVFQHVKGVKYVLAGYSGGSKVNPSYEDVLTERTGHAESVKITYDPRVVSYGQLLRVYFSVAHNPTELNFQGPDTGPSYRSNIFYTSEEQRSVAVAYIAQLTKANVFSGPIVTRVDKASAFYPAEAYHQDFLIKNPEYPYIKINDKPKLENFKRLLPELYNEQPVRV